MEDKAKKLGMVTGALLVGFLLGGYFLSDTQPRSFLAATSCKQCWELNQITGLMVSAGVAKTPGLIPNVVQETEYTIVVRHPFPQASTHLVVLPKKDIKDIADITVEDQPYITDAMAVIGELVRERGLESYRVVTNGPGYQSVRYLHFHVVSRE